MLWGCTLLSEMQCSGLSRGVSRPASIHVTTGDTSGGQQVRGISDHTDSTGVVCGNGTDFVVRSPPGFCPIPLPLRRRHCCPWCQGHRSWCRCSTLSLSRVPVCRSRSIMSPQASTRAGAFGSRQCLMRIMIVRDSQIYYHLWYVPLSVPLEIHCSTVYV